MPGLDGGRTWIASARDAWFNLPLAVPNSASSTPRPPWTFSNEALSSEGLADVGGVPTLTARARWPCRRSPSAPAAAAGPTDDDDSLGTPPRPAASSALTSMNADSSCSPPSTDGPIGDSSAISGGLDDDRRREVKPVLGLGGASCEALLTE